MDDQAAVAALAVALRPRWWPWVSRYVVRRADLEPAARAVLAATRPEPVEPSAPADVRVLREMERLCLDRAADAVRKARDNGLPTNAPNPVAATWERAANLAAHLRTSIEARDRGIND